MSCLQFLACNCDDDALACGVCRRQSEIDARARDVRLQRALEEVERFKILLQEQRAADKDHKDVNKSEYNRLFAGMSRLA